MISYNEADELDVLRCKIIARKLAGLDYSALVEELEEREVDND